MLDPFALLSVGVFSVSSLAVAVHLLVLARRSGGSPELLLGSSFLLTLLGNATITVVLGRDIGSGDLRTHVIQAAATAVNAGFILAAIFIALVYRRQTAWARVLVWGLSLGLIGTQIFTWVVMDPARDYLAVYWMKFGLREFVFLWGAVEAFNYYGLMRKRVRHGLSDPVVANRFLLWGVASTLGFVMVASFQVSGAMGFNAGTASALMAAGAWIGAPAGLLFWLTFFAPPAYRRWVSRHSNFGVHADA